MNNILITKNFNKSHPLIAALKNSGFNVIVEPLFKVEAIEQNVDYLDEVKNIILTSANCEEFFFKAALDRNIRVFAIGRQTANMAKRCGFRNIEIANQKSALTVKELFLKSNVNKSDLTLYPRGEVITMDLKNQLGDLGHNIVDLITYKTINNQSFSEDLLNFCQNNQIHYVSIYSPNSARIFASLAQKHDLVDYFMTSEILGFSEKIISLLKEACDKSWADSVGSFDKIKILKEFYD